MMTLFAEKDKVMCSEDSGLTTDISMIIDWIDFADLSKCNGTSMFVNSKNYIGELMTTFEEKIAEKKQRKDHRNGKDRSAAAVCAG